MASTATATATSATIFLVFNILFFTMLMQQVTPTTPPSAACPVDPLKFSGCGALVGGFVHGGLGPPPSNGTCCTLVNGLADIEAVDCLCTAIKANVMGINLDVPVSLKTVLNSCGKDVPTGYQCA